MVAKSELKFIRSLHQKKYRLRHGLFVAEGVKLVGELLASPLRLHSVYATEPELFQDATPLTERELKQASSLVHPNKVLAVFHIPQPAPLQFSDWVLALDGVRDPGNLGTLIRLCDWFGIGRLLCSPDTVDAYNPNVLQATMGSIRICPFAPYAPPMFSTRTLTSSMPNICTRPVRTACGDCADVQSSSRSPRTQSARVTNVSMGTWFAGGVRKTPS